VFLERILPTLLEDVDHLIGPFLLPPRLNWPIYKVFLKRILPTLLEDVDHLIGPFFLPPRPNGPIYKVFLERILPTLLEDVPLIVRRQMWIQHDGAPKHFSNISRDYLDAAFHGRWIGRGGHVKSLIYDTPVDNKFELLAWIDDH
jgi:hypothetical protein